MKANTIEELAALLNTAEPALAAGFEHVAWAARPRAPDPFGRAFPAESELNQPYRAINITDALFHTQGGLMITSETRVVRSGGVRLPNLFAGGGAAVGVSGSSASGDLSGNGLMTATVFGRPGGEHASKSLIGRR